MNRGRIILVAGIIVLALIGIGFLFPNTSPQNTVWLTDSGFSPREVTISKGETVTFVNKRDAYFWPASDFHPTHATYAEFDALDALPPGSSWEFQFEKTGLFKYHDHLAPFFFGIVRVHDEDGIVVDDCRERGGELACWQDEIFLALAERGIGAAYDTVGSLYESEPAFAGSCHFIAHNIGLASYGFYRENASSIMSPKASACASGFYHGFMEAYLGATGDVSAAGRTCEQIGEVLSNEAPDARLQCYHGIGHGAMELIVATSGVFNDLDEVVHEALNSCEQASEGEEERFRCASGLFNGIANFYINNEYGLSVEKENPIALCSRQKPVYQEACYGNMNSVVFWMADNNFSAAAQLLLENTNEEHKTVSLNYLAGLYAAQSLPVFPVEKIISDCKALGSFSPTCIQGFAHGLLEHGPPQTEYKGAIAFCSNILLSEHERDVCFVESISELAGWYSPETVENICNELPVELRTYCVQ